MQIKMDIKILLLKSLSSKKPICSSRRIHLGKSCFIIKYIVRGKFLTIKSVKNTTSKRKTWSQRIKHYHKVYKMYRKRKNELTVNVGSSVNKLYEEKETLTIEIPRLTKGIQTEAVKLSPTITESKSQQTIASVIFNRKRVFREQLSKSSKCSQTDLISTGCRGVQCKRLTQIKATNTDDNTRSSSTQVQSDLCIIASVEKSPEPVANCIGARDLNVLIYMLNEIGEVVVNQNHLLNNHSEMMKHIMQISEVGKSKSLESACRPSSTQTDLIVNTEKKNNSSQTVTNVTKPRKLLFLKGRCSQHK